VIRRAQDRAAQTEDAGHILRGQRPRPRGIQQPVEAVLEPDHIDVGVAGGLTTARMTAFSPGASPPPVSTPIFRTDDI
jgi:hypothetical protein